MFIISAMVISQVFYSSLKTNKKKYFEDFIWSFDFSFQIFLNFEINNNNKNMTNLRSWMWQSTNFHSLPVLYLWSGVWAININNVTLIALRNYLPNIL